MLHKVSVVLPTLNEVGHVHALVKQLLELLTATGWQTELLVVDDGSTDGTAMVVSKLASTFLPGQVRLLQHPPPRGLAASLLFGMEKAAFDTVLFMDADFNHRPGDVSRLLQAFVAAGGREAVSGSRFLPGGGMPGCGWRMLGSSLFNQLARNLLFPEITDYLAGFVVFDRRWLPLTARQEIFTGYGDYCLRLLVCLHQRGITIRELPVSYGHRPSGVSHTHVVKLLPQYLRSLFVARRTVVTKTK